MVKPNPHGFKAITKIKSSVFKVGLKRKFSFSYFREISRKFIFAFREKSIRKYKKIKQIFAKITSFSHDFRFSRNWKKRSFQPHFKHHYYQPAQHWGGCFICSPEQLNNNTWITLTLSSKAHWKLRFYWNPRTRKSLLRYFARHYWFFKNILFKPSSRCFRFYKRLFLPPSRED
jgi:hypothetical protein